VAHKAGHALHTQLVSRLLADTSLWTETSAEPEDLEPGDTAYPAAEAQAAT
jgi:UDP-3-O-acyl-N-acetylglucosamine deacetylase